MDAIPDKLIDLGLSGIVILCLAVALVRMFYLYVAETKARGVDAEKMRETLDKFADQLREQTNAVRVLTEVVRDKRG